MWVAKFELDGSKIFFGEASKKFNLELTGYPISSYEEKRNFLVNIIGTIKGEEANKKRFLKFLKKSKYVLNIEESNSFFNILIKEDKEFKQFYSPFFIYLSPVKINNFGAYIYHLGSWNRNVIAKLLDFAEKNYKYKLKILKEEKINNISILGAQPDLTDKQRKSYELAVKKGYYNYPKKIEIKELAKLSGISYSTFQQHLKYAEKKISNFFVGKY